MALVEGPRREQLVVASMVGLALQKGLLTAPKRVVYTVTASGYKLKGIPIGDFRVTVERL